MVRSHPLPPYLLLLIYNIKTMNNFSEKGEEASGSLESYLEGREEWLPNEGNDKFMVSFLRNNERFSCTEILSLHYDCDSSISRIFWVLDSENSRLSVPYHKDKENINTFTPWDVRINDIQIQILGSFIMEFPCGETCEKIAIVGNSITEAEIVERLKSQDKDVPLFANLQHYFTANKYKE